MIARSNLWCIGMGVTAGALVYGMVLRCIITMTTVHTYTLTIDPIFSHQVLYAIQTAIAQVPTGSSLHGYCVPLDALCAHHASIAAYTLALHEPHAITITIRAHQPSIIINNAYCSADQGTAYGIDEVDVTIRETLPTIAVSDYHYADQTLNRELVSWVRSVPSMVRDAYTLIWHDETRRCLESRGTSLQHTLLFAEAVTCAHDKLDACIASIREQQERCKSVYHWTADMRFADQIILKKESIQKNAGG
jgi:hypothetical protein